MHKSFNETVFITSSPSADQLTPFHQQIPPAPASDRQVIDDKIDYLFDCDIFDGVVRNTSMKNATKITR